MPISREDVIQSYELLLGREPENELVVQERMRNCHSVRGLVESLALTDEFKARKSTDEHMALNGDSSALVERVKERLKDGHPKASARQRIANIVSQSFSFIAPGDAALIRRIVREFAAPHAAGYARALAMTLFVAASSALIAFMIGNFVNATYLTRSVAKMGFLALGWFALFALRGLTTYGQDITLARIGNRITADVQRRILGRLLAQGVGYFAVRRSTEFMMNATLGAASFANILKQLFLSGARDGLTIAFLIIAMIWQSPLMTVICLAVMPMALYGVERMVVRAHEVSVTHVIGSERLLGTIQEVVQGFRLVKAFRLEKVLSENIDRNIANLERASNHLAKVSGLTWPIVESFSGAGIGLAFLYGSYRVLEANAAPGDFIAFILSFMMLFDPVRRLAALKIDLSASLVMAQAQFEFFDAPAAEERDSELPPAKVSAGRVELDNVVFSYVPNHRVLDGMSFVAEPGKITALVGLSGGGKTTIFNLLLRFYEPTSGAIVLDGQDISTVSRASLRDAMAYVGQEVYLFEGTIRENLMLGRADASEAEMIEASRAAFAHDFILRFPRGYDSPVGESGSLLSQGQRQRISIARALLKDAPIVLLDEPTASLDAESEQFVQLAIRRLCAGKTTLAIAHRLNTIVDSDRIYVIEDGAVVESGRHEELMKQEGRYATFFNIQFDVELA